MRLSETGVACACACLRGVETGVAFAHSCLCGVETAIAFAGENRLVLACFSVAVVLLVSTVAVQGRALVTAVSYWPASAVAEASLVSKSPRPVREKVRPARSEGGWEREKVRPAHEKCPKNGVLWPAGRTFSRKHRWSGCTGRILSRVEWGRGRTGRILSRLPARHRPRNSPWPDPTPAPPPTAGPAARPFHSF